jgi:hypothetical protein
MVDLVFILSKIAHIFSFMQTFVQLGSKKWFISLIFASAFISSLDRGESMRYISCLKIKIYKNPPSKTMEMVYHA